MPAVKIRRRLAVAVGGKPAALPGGVVVPQEGDGKFLQRPRHGDDLPQGKAQDAQLLRYILRGEGPKVPLDAHTGDVRHLPLGVEGKGLLENALLGGIQVKVSYLLVSVLGQLHPVVHKPLGVVMALVFIDIVGVARLPYLHPQEAVGGDHLFQGVQGHVRPAQNQLRQLGGGLPLVAGELPQPLPCRCLLKAGVDALCLAGDFLAGNGLVDLHNLPVNRLGQLQAVVLRPLQVEPSIQFVEVVAGAGVPHVDKQIAAGGWGLSRLFLQEGAVQQQGGQAGAHQRLGGDEILLFPAVQHLQKAHPVLPCLAGVGEEGEVLHHPVKMGRFPEGVDPLILSPNCVRGKTEGGAIVPIPQEGEPQLPHRVPFLGRDRLFPHLQAGDQLPQLSYLFRVLQQDPTGALALHLDFLCPGSPMIREILLF